MTSWNNFSGGLYCRLTSKNLWKHPSRKKRPTSFKNLILHLH